MRINRISIIFSGIITTILLTGFRGPSPTTTVSQESRKGIWSIPVGLGVHWKPKAEAVNNEWMGVVVDTGIKWEKLFFKRHTFAAELLWGLFLPDMFMANKPTEFHIQLIKNFTIPYNLALLIPMTSLQLGYVVNSQWHLACGLIYYYGLELHVNYRLSRKIALNTRCCFFLDKVLFDNHGIHLGFATIGITYKLCR